MSPEYLGVFQLLKEVTFRRILAFFNLRKCSRFGVLRTSHTIRDWLRKWIIFENRTLFRLTRIFL